MRVKPGSEGRLFPPPAPCAWRLRRRCPEQGENSRGSLARWSPEAGDGGAFLVLTRSWEACPCSSEPGLLAFAFIKLSRPGKLGGVHGSNDPAGAQRGSARGWVRGELFRSLRRGLRAAHRCPRVKPWAWWPHGCPHGRVALGDPSIP